MSLCWQLGLAEKNILNYDFDPVASDPSDANTNSTTLFSDDTDDLSRRSTNPEMGMSTHQEDEVSIMRTWSLASQNKCTVWEENLFPTDEYTFSLVKYILPWILMCTRACPLVLYIVTFQMCNDFTSLYVCTNQFLCNCKVQTAHLLTSRTKQLNSFHFYEVFRGDFMKLKNEIQWKSNSHASYFNMCKCVYRYQ